MSDPESFDAFYARTVRSVTGQMRALTGDAEDADQAVREAYARAFQQWYEVSGYRDAEGWVLDSARDIYRRAAGSPGGSGGSSPWPGAGGSSTPGQSEAGRQQPGSWPGTASPGPGTSALGGSPAGDGQLPGRDGPQAAFGGQGIPSNGSANNATSVLADQGGAKPADPPWGPGGPPGRRGLLPSQLSSGKTLSSRKALTGTVAVIAVACLAVGGYLVFGRGSHRPGGTAAPRASATARAKPKAHMLPAGKIGGRAAIPWSLVGTGWTLAEVSSAQPTADGGPGNSGTSAIYLVDPKGGRYAIRSWPGGSTTLFAWSGNGAQALLRTPGSNSTTYSLLSLTTGQVTSMPLAADVTVVGFTRPLGLAILAVKVHGNRAELQRYNPSGTLQATIAKLARKATQPGWQPGSCGSDCGALSSPDGVTDIWGTTWNEMQLVSNLGGVIRRLRVPGSGKPPACAPLSWWNSQTVLANCASPGQPSAVSDRLWLVPVDGSTPTPLTSGSGVPSGADFNVTAAQANGTAYVTQTSFNQCPSSPSGPGGLDILQVQPGGGLSTVGVPGSTNTRNTVLDGVGSRLLVLAQTQCPGSYSLLWLDPGSSTGQTLLSAPSGELGVTAAVPYGTW